MQRSRALLALLAMLAASDTARPESYGAFRGNAPQIVVQGPPPPADAVFAWSSDSQILVSASVSRRAVQLWDARTGNLINAIGLQWLKPATLIFGVDLSISADAQKIALRTDSSATRCRTYDIDVPTSVTDVTETARHGSCSHDSPHFPTARDGSMLIANGGGYTISNPRRAPVVLAARTSVQLIDLAVTPDATSALSLAAEVSGALQTTVASHAEVWSLTSGVRTATLRVAGAYRHIRWLDAGHFMLSGDGNGRFTSQPTLIIDAARSKIIDRASFRCVTIPYRGVGTMIATRASRCGELAEISLGMATPGLWVRTPGSAWRPVRATGLGAPVVEALATTPNGMKTALLTRRTTAYAHPNAANQGALITVQSRLMVIEGNLLADTPAVARTVPIDWLSDDERAHHVMLTPDGKHVVVETDMAVRVIDLATGKQLQSTSLGDDKAPIVAIDNVSLIAVPTGGDQVANLQSLTLAEPNGYLSYIDNALSAGFVAGGGLVWIAAPDGSLRFFETVSGSTMLTLQRVGTNGFVTYDEVGRYDSPLGPDTNAFRWTFPDEPLRSLGGQTFMRDYFEPQLFGKTLACTRDARCDTALPQPPPVGRLNRTLPAVRIVRVLPGPTRDTAIVEVEAHSVEAPTPNGKTISGLYDLRLFRDGKLVGQRPEIPDVKPDRATAVAMTREDIATWRSLHHVQIDPMGLAINRAPVRESFTVRLPTGLDAAHVAFQAYAFNADRVKSDTARASYTRPLVWPTQHKAYLLTIGIDDYAEDRFHLDYAVADADLLAKRLSTVPGYAVNRLDLRGTGRRREATTAAIADAIALLAPGDHMAARARLKRLGVDASQFAAATPDDLVLITFAGHGWADPAGNFYLVPSNESWPEGQDLPAFGPLISSAELSNWLRPVDFGDAVIIIDACNSAAVVATTGFKPGPLGDRGLGQLAYDKGILILAASQTDQKAHEDKILGHGFLTAALARDGLDGGGFGQADLNGDGQITLDEWLRYAVMRLPTLSAEVADAGRGRDFRPVADDDEPTAASAVTPQQPSLFDFAGVPSRVTLGTEPWSAQVRRAGGTVAAFGRATLYGLSEFGHVLTDTLYGILALVAAVLVGGAVLLARWIWRVLRRRRVAPATN
jgi:hypothetical protein